MDRIATALINGNISDARVMFEAEPNKVTTALDLVDWLISCHGDNVNTALRRVSLLA